MLETLGFTALIAIIFGVSMVAAIGIILKVILWVIGICVAATIIDKMQASTVKALAWITIIAGGCLLAGIGSFRANTYAPCFSLDTNVFGWEAYVDCMSNATKAIETRFYASIWLIIIGAVLFIAAWLKNREPSNNTDNAIKRAGNTKSVNDDSKD